jgi:hypothetical protein
MKLVKSFLLTLISAAFVFGLSACDKQQGQEQPEDKTPGRASDLLTLFYQTVEKQNGVNPREKVYIVAHRANTQKAINEGVPENSLECIQMAIESGVVDMIEIDVRPTKDGVLVLMHDASINRTTNGKGNVSSLTYEQLMQYDMKRDTRPSSGIKVPTLKQALELCKGKMFINLDIHSKNVPIGDLANLIIECGMIDQVMIYSSQGELVEYPTIDPNFILHPYVSSVGAAGNYKDYFGAKLFQYGLDYAKKTNISFPADMRAAGYLTYTNILDYDNKLRSGDYTPLLTFIESETDFIQTDVAEIVHEFLDVEGLR